MKSWIWRGAIALPIAVALSLAPGRTTASPPALGQSTTGSTSGDTPSRAYPRVSRVSPDVPPSEPEDADGVRLDDKSRRDLALKAEYEQNLKDAARLVELTGQLKQDLEKNSRFVLSIATLKKTDEIELLVKRIRSRMGHN